MISSFQSNNVKQIYKYILLVCKGQAHAIVKDVQVYTYFSGTRLGDAQVILSMLSYCTIYLYTISIPEKISSKI